MLEEEARFLRGLFQENGFNQRELAENQLCRIARSQRARLWGVALEPLRASLIALLGWFLFLFVTKTFCPGVLFSAIEIAMGQSLYVWFTFITAGVVLAFVSNLFGSFEPVVNLALDILRVSEQALHILRPYSGSVFRVYVTPRSRLLLSIEPVKLRRADRVVK